MILRKFISKRLGAYYSQGKNRVVGSLQNLTNSPSSSSSFVPNLLRRSKENRHSINFKFILGELHWKYKFDDIYKKQQGQWITPVELFFPYYSNSLGTYIANQIIEDENNNNEEKEFYDEIQIIEFGGGRGTNAHTILSHLKTNYRDIYDRVFYFMIDASPTLHKVQQEAFKNDETMKKKVKFIQKDMLDIAEGNVGILQTDHMDNSAGESQNRQRKKIKTIAIALEVMDNLPHDKIKRCENTGNLMEAHVKYDKKKQMWTEKFVPLNDPILKEILDIESSYTFNASPSSSSLSSSINKQTSLFGNRTKWIPTVACKSLLTLFRERPNHNISLILADFDSLPPPTFVSTHTTDLREGGDEETSNSSSIQTRYSSYGIGEPLVTCMNDIDHECYLAVASVDTSNTNTTYSTTTDDMVTTKINQTKKDPSEGGLLCDILFPTDFLSLQSFLNKSLNNHHQQQSNKKYHVHIAKQGEFLMNNSINLNDEIARKQIKETTSYISGYNPMIEDFGNCSILTVDTSSRL